jgi:hypothetical protein
MINKYFIISTLILFVSMFNPLSGYNPEYKILSTQDGFNSKYDLLIISRNDSTFHVLIESKKLSHFEISDIFKKDSSYDILLCFKEDLLLPETEINESSLSGFSNYHYVKSENLDSLRIGSFLFEYSLDNIKNSEIVVYDVLNLKKFIDEIDFETPCFNIHKFIERSKLYKSNLSLNYERKERIKEFEIYSDFIIVKKHDDLIVKEIITRNELFDLREELDLEDNYLGQVTYLNIDYKKLDKSKFKHNLPETYFFYTKLVDYWLFAEVSFPEYSWSSNKFFSKVLHNNKNGFLNIRIWCYSWYPHLQMR